MMPSSHSLPRLAYVSQDSNRRSSSQINYTCTTIPSGQGLRGFSLLTYADHFHTRTPPFLFSSPSHSLPPFHTSLYPCCSINVLTPSSRKSMPKNTRYRGHSWTHGCAFELLKDGGAPGTEAGKGDAGNNGFTFGGKYVCR
jgi:hypothetical protein